MAASSSASASGSSYVTAAGLVETVGIIADFNALHLAVAIGTQVSALKSGVEGKKVVLAIAQSTVVPIKGSAGQARIVKVLPTTFFDHEGKAHSGALDRILILSDNAYDASGVLNLWNTTSRPPVFVFDARGTVDTSGELPFLRAPEDASKTQKKSFVELVENAELLGVDPALLDDAKTDVTTAGRIVLNNWFRVPVTPSTHYVWALLGKSFRKTNGFDADEKEVLRFLCGLKQTMSLQAETSGGGIRDAEMAIVKRCLLDESGYVHRIIDQGRALADAITDEIHTSINDNSFDVTIDGGRRAVVLPYIGLANFANAALSMLVEQAEAVNKKLVVTDTFVREAPQKRLEAEKAGDEESVRKIDENERQARAILAETKPYTFALLLRPNFTAGNMLVHVAGVPYYDPLTDAEREEILNKALEELAEENESDGEDDKETKKPTIDDVPYYAVRSANPFPVVARIEDVEPSSRSAVNINHALFVLTHYSLPLKGGNLDSVWGLRKTQEQEKKQEKSDDASSSASPPVATAAGKSQRSQSSNGKNAVVTKTQPKQQHQQQQKNKKKNQDAQAPAVTFEEQ